MEGDGVRLIDIVFGKGATQVSIKLVLLLNHVLGEEKRLGKGEWFRGDGDRADNAACCVRRKKWQGKQRQAWIELATQG